MRKPWATKVINAIGRKILREASLKEIKLTNEAKYEHPEWMIDMIKIDWPNTWKEILVGILALINPVITSTEGLCVARIK